MIQRAAEILNINLIFLRHYCPDLNPIEDIWRVIKKTTACHIKFKSNKYIKDCNKNSINKLKFMGVDK